MPVIPPALTLPNTFRIIDLLTVNRDSHLTTEGTPIPARAISSPSIEMLGWFPSS